MNKDIAKYHKIDEIVNWVYVNKSRLMKKQNLIYSQNNWTTYGKPISLYRGYFSPSIVYDLVVGGVNRGAKTKIKMTQSKNESVVEYIMNSSGLPLILKTLLPNGREARFLEIIEYFENHSFCIQFYKHQDFVVKTIQAAYYDNNRIKKIITLHFGVNSECKMDHISSIEIENYNYDDNNRELLWVITDEPYSTLLASVRKREYSYKLHYDEKGRIQDYIEIDGTVNKVKKKRSIYDNFALKKPRPTSK